MPEPGSRGGHIEAATAAVGMLTGRRPRLRRGRFVPTGHPGKAHGGPHESDHLPGHKFVTVGRSDTPDVRQRRFQTVNPPSETAALPKTITHDTSIIQVPAAPETVTFDAFAVSATDGQQEDKQNTQAGTPRLGEPGKRESADHGDEPPGPPGETGNNRPGDEPQDIDSLLAEVIRDTDRQDEKLRLLATMSMKAARSFVGAAEDASWAEVQHEAVRNTPLQAVLLQADQHLCDVGGSITELPLFLVNEDKPEPTRVDLHDGLPPEREVLLGYRIVAKLLEEAKLEIAARSNGAEDIDSSVVLASEWLAKASDYQPQPHELEDALVFAKLGRLTRLQIAHARYLDPGRRIDVSRFTDPNEDYERNEQIMRKFMDAEHILQSPDHVEYEKRVAMVRSYIRKHAPDEEAEQLSDDDIINHFVINVVPGVTQEFIEQASTLNLALYLDANVRVVNSRDEAGTPSQDSPIDWIHDAPFPLIREMAQKLMGATSVEENTDLIGTALHHYLFPGLDLGQNHNWLMTQSQGIIKGIAPFTQEMSREPNADPETIYNAGLYMYFRRDIGRRLIADGYQMQDILQNHWLIDTMPRSRNGEPYPIGADSNRRYRWFADNAPDYLEDGWNRVAIGKILHARISELMKRNDTLFFDLGDVSDCLQIFTMPERASIDGLSDPVRLYDMNLEREFLVNLVRQGEISASELRLPQKSGMVDLLFKNSVNRFLYEALLAGSGDEQALRGYIEGNIDDFFNRFQPTTTTRTSKSIFAREVYTQLNAIQMAAQKQQEEPVNLHQQIGTLKNYGLSRQAYINDATVWLTRHATVETERLEKAWQHRREARLQGSQDSLGAILETWQLSEETRLGLPKLRVYNTDMPNGEIKARYGDWLAQLRPFYSEAASMEIIRSCAINNTADALFPAVTLRLGNEGQYFGEILAKDDPHGATIGCETNCCMRYESWYPEAFSDIQANYRWPLTGLVAFYGPDGRIDSQDFFWTNPDHPDTLVLDSLEAKEGRHPENARPLNIEFWRRVLIDKIVRTNGEFPIRKVHVGGDQERTKLRDLPSAEVIPALPGLHTDAEEKQYLLFEITEADIAVAKTTGTALITESVVRPEVKQLRTMTISGNEQVVLDIESRAYPQEQQYENPDRIKGITGQRLGADFSFLTIDDDNRPTGYALANIVPVQTSKGIVQMLHVDDVAVDPENRHQSTTGLQILRELFTRATDRGLQGITARARESTMYRLLKSSYVQDIIKKMGYELIDEGIDTTENTGEEPYYRIFIRKRLEEPAVTAQ